MSWKVPEVLERIPRVKVHGLGEPAKIGTTGGLSVDIKVMEGKI
jgi:hypothetical protein